MKSGPELPLRALSTLQLALGVSVAVHAALLTVRFVDPEGFNRVFQDTPLEVILVNAKSDEKPDKATRHRAGFAGRRRRCGKRPRHLAAATRRGGQARRHAGGRRATDRGAQGAAKPDPGPGAQAAGQHAAAGSAGGQSRARSRSSASAQRQALVKILAEIEKRINEENARPHEALHQPGHARSGLRDLLRRAAPQDRRPGHHQLPRSRRAQAVWRAHHGDHGEPHRQRAATPRWCSPRATPRWTGAPQAIVRSLKFGRFSDAMRRRADQIVVVSRFRFTRDATLQTQMSAQ